MVTAPIITQGCCKNSMSQYMQSSQEQSSISAIVIVIIISYQ